MHYGSARHTTLCCPSTGATGALLAYLLFGACAIRLALPNFKAIVAEEAASNARYKAVHTRVKTHCESIAFFGGEAPNTCLYTCLFTCLFTCLYTCLTHF